MKDFLNWGSILSDDYSLCQEDIELASTAGYSRNPHPQPQV